MALHQSTLLEVLKAAEVDDRIRQAVEAIYQAPIEAGPSVIGALPHERAASRTGQRNGYWPRTITTTAGIWSCGSLSCGPSLSYRRCWNADGGWTVAVRGDHGGLPARPSTREVDDLGQGAWRRHWHLQERGVADSAPNWRPRSPRSGTVAGRSGVRYVLLDATCCEARVDHRVISEAVVVATGVAADGHREVLGFEVGGSENGAFWTSFRVRRRPGAWPGVQLVISDAHAGLRAAIAAVLLGASWQRCRVHFLHNALAEVPKVSAEMVAAAIRTILA
jgi:putative transposase